MLRPELFAALSMIAATLTILAWRRPLGALRFALSPRVLLFLFSSALITARVARTQAPPAVLLCGVVLAGVTSVVSRAT